MRNITSKIDGNSYPAAIYNPMRDELENTVLSTDQTLDIEAGPDTDLNMLGKAAALYGSAADFYTDGGGANAYVLTRSTNLKKVPAYKDGMLIVWKAVAANTGASTINVTSIGVVALVDENNIALVGDEVSTVFYNQARYNNSTSKFHLVTLSIDTLKISRAQFDPISDTQFSITGGAYAHFGSVSQVLLINSTITHTITSPGTSRYQYIYLDDSAIVSAGTKIITGSEIINSPTPPTPSLTKKGLYNGEDLCIFAVYIDADGDIQAFSHVNDEVMFWSWVTILNQAQTASTDYTYTLIIPTFSRMGRISITSQTHSADGQMYWRTHETVSVATGTITLFSFLAAEAASGGQFIAVSDSSQQIVLRCNGGNISTVFVKQSSWFFPQGM
jgi:hypothetical protein